MALSSVDCISEWLMPLVGVGVIRIVALIPSPRNRVTACHYPSRL